MPPAQQRLLASTSSPAVLLQRLSRPASATAGALIAYKHHRAYSAAGPGPGPAASHSIRLLVKKVESSGVVLKRGFADEKKRLLPRRRIWAFDEVKSLVTNGDVASGGVVIVDVREPAELKATGKIPGAINLPLKSAAQSFHIPEAEFRDMYGFERPSRDCPLLFYCKAGVRARMAAELAKGAGWEGVGEYPGSWDDWKANGGPVERC